VEQDTETRYKMFSECILCNLRDWWCREGDEMDVRLWGLIEVLRLWRLIGCNYCDFVGGRNGEITG
jgi:hypothetical protein